MDDAKKVISGTLVLAVFVFIVAISSFYVQTQISIGNACGCFIPLPLFIPFLASIGLFIGTLIYYLFSPRFEREVLDKNLFYALFNSAEKEIIKYLAEHKDATQAKIVRETSLSKVKVFRTLRKLAQRGVIEKRPHGKTNMVRLNNKFLRMLE